MTTVALPLGRQVEAIGLVGFGHFLSHMYQLALPPLFYLLVPELGVSWLVIAIPVTVMNVATGTLQTPVGFLVDRIGARMVLAAGLLVTGAGMAMAGVIGTYWGLVAGLLVAGVGNSVFHPCDYALLSSSIEKQRLGRALSIHSFGGSGGFAAAPFVMVLLAEAWDWRTALIAVGVVGIAAAVVLILRGGSFREYHETQPARGKDKGARPSLRMLLNRPVMVFFLFYVLLAGAGSGLNSFTPVALMGMYEINVESATFVLTIFLIAVMVSVLFGGLLADWTDRHDLVLYLCYGTGAACLFLVATGLAPFWAVMILFGVAGTARGVVNPTRDLLVRQITPPGSIGAVYAFVSTGFNIGQAIAPLIYGWFMDRGEPNSVFYLAGAIMVAAILLVHFGRGTPAERQRSIAS